MRLRVSFAPPRRTIATLGVAATIAPRMSRMDFAPLRPRNVDGQLIEVWRARADAPLLEQRAEPDKRPYIYPILAPDGRGVLGAALYTAFDDVNGVGFDARNAAATPGTFHPLLLGPQRLEDRQALWSVISQWRAPDGLDLLGESQRWTLTDHGHAYDLDLLWTLSANVDLTFGPASAAGLVVRVGSQEITPAAGSGPAGWNEHDIPLEGEAGTAGVALMRHPTNAVHLDRAASGATPAWAMGAGELIAFRYRLFIAAGPLDPDAVRASWEQFSRVEDEGEPSRSA